MRKLELDFNFQRRRSVWIGWALVLAALALWGDMGASYLRLQDEKTELEQKLIRSGMTGKAVRLKRGVSATPAEVEQARAIIARIGIPWSDLFKAVEAVRADQVALLAIEPDPKSGKLELRGDAADLPAVLTYVARLSRAPQLHEVYLVRHEIKPDGDPARPVEFSISARWGALP